MNSCIYLKLPFLSQDRGLKSQDGVVIQQWMNVRVVHALARLFPLGNARKILGVSKQYSTASKELRTMTCALRSSRRMIEKGHFFTIVK